MKKLFKSILPLMAVIFAVTFALHTNANSRNGVKAIVTGYIQHPGQAVECEAADNCTTVVNSTFCRVGQLAANPRLYDLNAQSKCTVTLYKP